MCVHLSSSLACELLEPITLQHLAWCLVPGAWCKQWALTHSVQTGGQRPCASEFFAFPVCPTRHVVGSIAFLEPWSVRAALPGSSVSTQPRKKALIHSAKRQQPGENDFQDACSKFSENKNYEPRTFCCFCYSGSCDILDSSSSILTFWF